MPTAIYFTSDAELRVTESPAEVEKTIATAGPIARLSLFSGEALYFRVDRVTHWHQTDQRDGSAGAPEKPHAERGVPRTF